MNLTPKISNHEAIVNLFEFDMKELPRLIVFLLLIVSLYFLTHSHPAYADDPTDQMRQSIDAVIAVLKDKELKTPGRAPERRAKLQEIVYDRFAFSEMAKRSLALNWRKRTPEERKEFVSLFADLIEKTYIKKIERYTDEKILYVGESIDDSYAEVRTKVVTRTETEIPIEYRLMKQEGKWLVYDVTIEGVSLVNNYRSQFAYIIDSGSYEELVARLKKKAEEERQ